MSTTGTQSSGTMTGLNDILKNVYEPAMQNQIVAESEVWDLFTQQEGFEVADGPDGKQVNIGHLFSAGGGEGFMLEDDYIPTAGTPNAKQSNITIKQIGATVELSGRTLRRVKQGPAAFATWADEILPLKAERVAFKKDRALLGAGTGILFRINGAPDGTGDGINNAFGISGLENAPYLVLEGDSLVYSPNADGSSARAGAVTVSAIDYANSAIDTGGTTPTSAASGDYVFLGDANLPGYGGRETMGLEGIVDDGSVLATFQGLSRSSNPKMKAQVIDASSQFSGVLSEDLVVYADSIAWQRGKGRPDVLLASYSGGRSFWKLMKQDRMITDPRGQFTGGLAKDGLNLIIGDRTINLKMCRKVPDSRAFLLEKKSLKMYQIGNGKWDDTTGSIWQRVTNSTGRKDAFYAFYVEEYEVACRTPNHNVKITGLAAA